MPAAPGPHGQCYIVANDCSAPNGRNLQWWSKSWHSMLPGSLRARDRTAFIRSGLFVRMCRDNPRYNVPRQASACAQFYLTTSKRKCTEVGPQTGKCKLGKKQTRCKKRSKKGGAGR